MPLGVGTSNSEPVYLTDQLGNPLVRVQGSNGDYGLPVVIAGFEDLTLDDLTTRLDAIRAAVGVLTARKTLAVEVTKTGAGDTTAYTAKDVFNAATGAGVPFVNLARVAGGSGVVVRARLTTDQKTNVARWRLHLWNAAPAYVNDNSPFLFLYANEPTYQGSIDFDAMATEDATNSTAAYTQKSGYLLPFICNAASASLFGELEVLDGFTPTSGQKITVTLTVDQG